MLDHPAISLFFDVYIVSDFQINSHPNGSNPYRSLVDSNIRESCHAFRLRSKLEVTMYTLDSYSCFNFKDIIIRFECEDSSHVSSFLHFCKNTFPTARIFSERSDTALDYIKALNANLTGNPWVFFSPNNDHPFIGTSPDLAKYISVAQSLESKYNDHIISVYYSHMADLVNMKGMATGLWGTWEFVYPKVVFENEFCFALKMNKFCGDSIQILRLKTLHYLFKNNLNHGRVIRLEDLSSYFSTKIKHIIVVPKKEICRHYDASFHIKYWPSMEAAPQPLFIPDGFFESSIKIRYGFSDYVKGYVNINPLAKKCRYLTDSGPDMNCHIDDIPFSWRNKIAITEVTNNSIISNLVAKDSYSQILALNAWIGYPRSLLFLFSLVRIIRFPFLLPFVRSRQYLYKCYGQASLYKEIVRCKNYLRTLLHL